MSKFLFIIGSLTAAFISIYLFQSLIMPNIQPSPKIKYSVVKEVIDGDTFVLSDNSKIRLLGINSPEENEIFFEEAKDALEQLILNKNVILEQSFGYEDKYGRKIGYVFVDNIFINLKMIELGLAHVIMIEHKYFKEFISAEHKAMESSKGIWNFSNEKYVKDGCIKILEFHYNAKGNDNENLNDEYIVFQNDCNYSIDFDSWYIKDDYTNTYIFKSFILAPNNSFTLYSGKGSDSSNNIYLNSTHAIWNNSGDRLFLRNKDNELVIESSYMIKE